MDLCHFPSWPEGMVMGFTGTRFALTSQQNDMLLLIVEALQPPEVHHGDCVGADAAFHCFVTARVPESLIIIHPPIIPKYRAYCRPTFYGLIPEKNDIERNHDIVNACDILFATPRTTYEQLRSGTWATVRYARSIGKPTVVILP